MVASGIPSARRKLARALMHADALDAEVDAFRATDPYDFEMKSLGNPRGESDFRVLVKLTRCDPVPESWALMMGDFLTNARAALDHAIYQHVRSQNSAIPEHRIQYPIFDDAQEFANRMSGRFSADVYRLIEDAQPYQSSDPGGHPFRILRDLVNVDKHRDLVVANYAVDAVEMEATDMYKLVSPPQVYKREMSPGATVARVHLRLVQAVREQWMWLPCTVVYGEMIEIPRFAEPAGLLQAINCIRDSIGPHLDNLDAAGC